MQTQSLWEHTLTFFPQFLAALKERTSPDATVAVVGASDGKFVLPLAAAESEGVALDGDDAVAGGGEVSLPGDAHAQVPGLIDRLKAEDLRDRVQVIGEDFLTAELPEGHCDAVWTSCSWHYSANHRSPLGDFVRRMQDLVRKEGLFGAEFMMPVEERHQFIEHYTSPERLARHFTPGWDVLLTVRTNQFIERPHLGQPHDHTHRMGLLIAAHTAR